MKLPHLKQILQSLSNTVATAEDTDAGGGVGIRDDVAKHSQWQMPPEISRAYGEALEALTKGLGTGEVWSRSSIDSVLRDFLFSISRLDKADRQRIVQRELAGTVAEFTREPIAWNTERLIFGMHENCAGATFGNVRFASHDRNDINTSAVLRPEEFPQGNLLFAELQTDAVDETSAIQRADMVLDDHLLILNALCCGVGAMKTQVSRAERSRPLYSAYRAVPVGETPERITATGASDRMPLMRHQLDLIMAGPVGSKVNRMLISPKNAFNQRVLRGFSFAGAACVDGYPERSFLMLAIALESAVLGKDTKAEITHQLANRVAHLIGNGLEGRRHVADIVGQLYDRRSKIVHKGEYGVSLSEAASMLFFCMSSLNMLIVSEAFESFTTDKELECWFRDRVLDGPNHFNPLQVCEEAP